MRNWMTPIIYTLVALAVFFVGYQLLTDTSSFLSSIGMMIVIAAIVYGAIYFFFLRNRGISVGKSSNEMKKYKQAVKQSKQKYKQAAPVVKKSQAVRSAKPTTIHKKSKRRGSGPQLRVIEGNKNKDKNRASF